MPHTTILLKQTNAFSPARTGQSLVEFIFLAPVMVLILVGAFSFGLGTYQAHMTSDAVQLAMLKSVELADAPGKISSGKLQGYINSGGLKGNLSAGKLVDELTVVNGRLLIARKNFTPLASFVPGFTISVGQAINPSLLKSISEGNARLRPLATPWVPGGNRMQPPPWTPEGAPEEPE